MLHYPVTKITVYSTADGVPEGWTDAGTLNPGGSCKPNPIVGIAYMMEMNASQPIVGIGLRVLGTDEDYDDNWVKIPQPVDTDTYLGYTYTQDLYGPVLAGLQVQERSGISLARKNAGDTGQDDDFYFNLMRRSLDCSSKRFGLFVGQN